MILKELCQPVAAEQTRQIVSKKEITDKISMDTQDQVTQE